jgi:pyruvate dehydrogenase E2 component (dihydrolipoamide acetyltransferase)
MPQKITVPRLGWSMEEGVFVEWLKAQGQQVRAGDMIFILEGEKAAQEIESVDSGVMCIPADAPRPGTKVQVGEVIGFLLHEGEPAPTSVTFGASAAANTSTTQFQSAEQPIGDQPVSPSSTQIKPKADARIAGPAARRLARELGIDLSAVPTVDPTGRVISTDIQLAAKSRELSGGSQSHSFRAIATPRAKRRAQELGVDWARIIGTGRDGRIRERDIQACHALGNASTSASPCEFSPSEPGSYQPASKLRLAIAQRTALGVHQAVPVTLTTKVDARSLVALRERLKLDTPAELVPGFNDILLHLSAQTLRERPEINSCWYRQGIHRYDEINIATAVDTPSGLVAPVVRQVDRLSLVEVAKATRILIKLAQSGKLSQNQLSGATFTLSNLGMFGIDAFTPVINVPQAAILGVGRIVDEPVVQNQQIVAGKTMTLSLTFDHRVIDGAPAARWLQRLSEKISTVQ